MLTLRIVIMALIWASALLAPAAAQEIRHDPAAPSAWEIAYRYESTDTGPSTPGPTDPNGPSS